jgi:diacylglycerol kinase family enzyme
MRGTHARNPRTITARSASFRLKFEQPPVFQADGELIVGTAAEFEVRTLPRAVNLVSA